MPKSKDASGMMITAVIALAVGVACYAIARTNPWATDGSGLPKAFTLDLSDLIKVDPALIQYEQVSEFPVAMDEVRAIAVGPNQKIHVAGDQAVHIFLPDGDKPVVLDIDGRPSCLAVAGVEHSEAGRIYVGVGHRIELFGADGKPAGSWDAFEANAILTSIAIAENDIFVADAGNRLVLRFDNAGKLIEKMGTPDPDREMPGFSVPSKYFDVAVDPEGMLHIANPGRLQIETYSLEGNLETFWGEAGSGIKQFFGCCNPSQFAMLPDGKFVTSEKGVPRIKIYSDEGEFESVVAGPEQLGIKKYEIGDPRSVQGGYVFDVATDANSRVLVLDPKKKCVRVFVRTKSNPDELEENKISGEPGQ